MRKSDWLQAGTHLHQSHQAVGRLCRGFLLALSLFTLFSLLLLSLRLDIILSLHFCLSILQVAYVHLYLHQKVSVSGAVLHQIYQQTKTLCTGSVKNVTQTRITSQHTS